MPSSLRPAERRGMREGDEFFSCFQHRVWPLSRAGSAPLAALQLLTGLGKEVSRSGGARRRRGGERERDLTAATAHFTACHALMAEEIKAGMELFIEINQSPRRRGENNIASSVIPGLPAPGRLSPKAPRELDPLGFVTGIARRCQKLPELPTSSLGVPGGRSWLLGKDGMRCGTWGWIFGAEGDPTSVLSFSHHAPGRANRKEEK